MDKATKPLHTEIERLLRTNATAITPAPSAMSRWQEIAKELASMDQRSEALLKEWAMLKNGCAHPNLPRREQMEEYMDMCPDCGHISYQYAL